MHGDGRQTRDFIPVELVTGMLCDAVRRRLTHPHPVDIGSGTRTDLLTLIVRLEGILGRRLVVEHAAPRPGEIRDSQADTTTMRSLFPDAPGADLTTALTATVAW